MIGCAKTSIDAWVGQGAPVVRKEGRKGVESQYNSREFIKWMVDRERAKAAARADAGDLDALKAEKLRVETELRQLELAKERGEVASLAEVQRLMTGIVIHARTQLLQLPQRVAPRVIGETNETRLKEVIEAEVRQALEELSQESVDAICEEAAEW